MRLIRYPSIRSNSSRRPAHRRLHAGLAAVDAVSGVLRPARRLRLRASEIGTLVPVVHVAFICVSRVANFYPPMLKTVAFGFCDRDDVVVSGLPPDAFPARSEESRRVRGLLEDDRGYLWVGTHFGGVKRFDPKAERFTVYPYVESLKYERMGERSSSLTARSSSRLGCAVPHRPD
jgi:hypothetical protein